MDTKTLLEQGKGILGIEFGSTRIKAVLVNDSGTGRRLSWLGEQTG